LPSILYSPTASLHRPLFIYPDHFLTGRDEAYDLHNHGVGKR